MHNVGTVLLLLCAVTFLTVASRRFHVPYPTFMVLAGLAIAIIPGLPYIELDPEIVFLMFLPPLLYGAAWETSWKDFRANIRPISMLACGLIVVTTLSVGWVAHRLIEDLPWAAAFALGAIVSPPDAVAATAVTRSLRVSRRISSILEGESLVNDATGLIAYRMATAAALTGLFSWEESVWRLFLAGGSVILGLLVGNLVARVHQMLDDPLIETTITLLTPFAAYLPAEALGMSGVLATVTTGLYLRRRAAVLFSSATRLHATAVWESLTFLVTGLTFILIGLQLPQVLHALREEPLPRLIGSAVSIFLVTVLVRMLWVYPAAWLPWLLSRRIREQEPRPDHGELLVVGWAGMRGVVSLAAAMSLPVAAPHSVEFPKRDMILFLVFTVILGTLVLQSLTLPWLIRRLKMSGEGQSPHEQEIDARLAALTAATQYLEKSAGHAMRSPLEVEYLRAHFELQASTLVSRMQWEHPEWEQPVVCQTLVFGALHAQRQKIQQLHDAGLLSDELLSKLERDIDLEETRLRSTTVTSQQYPQGGIPLRDSSELCDERPDPFDYDAG